MEQAALLYSFKVKAENKQNKNLLLESRIE